MTRTLEDALPKEAVDAAAMVQFVFHGAKIVMYQRACKLCGVDLIFVKTSDGDLMIFDAEPKEAWHVDVARKQARKYKAWVPHRETCARIKKKGPAHQ